MTKIPPKLKEEILQDPTYKTCMLYGHHGHVCDGRITFEHAIRYAGKQVQKKWAIIALCARGHEVDGYQDAHTMNKEMNEWCALSRASKLDLQEIYRSNPQQRLSYLQRKYGIWEQKFPLLPTSMTPPFKSAPVLSEKSISEAIKVLGEGQHLPLFPPERRTNLIMQDRIHLQAIKDHCRKVEGISYSDEKIISLALEEYAKMIEVAKTIAS